MFASWRTAQIASYQEQAIILWPVKFTQDPIRDVLDCATRVERICKPFPQTVRSQEQEITTPDLQRRRAQSWQTMSCDSRGEHHGSAPLSLIAGYKPALDVANSRPCEHSTTFFYRGQSYRHAARVVKSLMTSGDQRRQRVCRMLTQPINGQLRCIRGRPAVADPIDYCDETPFRGGHRECLVSTDFLAGNRP
jgi:hypothetical protein